MKSPQVAAIIPTEEQSGYTDLRVLQSAAGFYVGTLYEERNAEGEVVWTEPGSRDSGYFGSEAEAAAMLNILTAADTAGFPPELVPGVRMTP